MCYTDETGVLALTDIVKEHLEVKLSEVFQWLYGETPERMGRN